MIRIHRFVTVQVVVAMLVLVAGVALAPPAQAFVGARAGVLLDDPETGYAFGGYYRIRESGFGIEASLDVNWRTLEEARIDALTLPLRFNAHVYHQGERYQLYALAGLGGVFGKLEAPDGRDDDFLALEGQLGVGATWALDNAIAISLEVRHGWAEASLDDVDVDLGGWSVSVAVGPTFDFAY